jgi:hypothetical protein
MIVADGIIDKNQLIANITQVGWVEYIFPLLDINLLKNGEPLSKEFTRTINIRVETLIR